MSITLEVDEQALRSLPLRPEERERDMKIELACRYYAKGWLSFGQAARLAGLDHYTIAAEMAERGIPRNLTLEDVETDIADARRQSPSFYDSIEHLIGSVDGLPADFAEPGGMIPAPFDLPLPEPGLPVRASTVTEFVPPPFVVRERDLAPE
jgi:predicted HTH domain antitoxin